MSLFGSLFAGPAVPLSSEDHWLARMTGLGARTFAGTRVTEEASMSLPVVYSAVGIIADSIAQLPVDVYEKRGGSRQPVEDHPASAILNTQSNPYQTAMVARQTMQAHALLWGNGYGEIQRTAGGDLVALWPLIAANTRRVVGDPSAGYETTIDGQVFPLAIERVVHVPALAFDGLTGKSPIWLARQAIGLGLALEEFGSKFFANDAKSGGFLEHPGKLGPDAHARLVGQFNDQGGLTNAHRVKILEEGMTFQATSIPPEDAQFLATRSFQVEEIARLYRVPLFMLQNQSKDTAWGSGISQMMLGFLTFTLAPWLVRWEQELTAKLLTQAERDRGMYIKHNVNALLRGDIASRSAYYTAALSPATGWMRRDEVRALEDLNPDDDRIEDAQDPMQDREDESTLDIPDPSTT